MSQDDILSLLRDCRVKRPMNAVVSLYSGHSNEEYALDYTGYRNVMKWYADNYHRDDFKLAEVPKESTQFMIAFKLPLHDDDDSDDHDFLGPLVSSVRSALQATLDIPVDELDDLRSFVLISDCYTEDDQKYIDVRVQFPFIVVSREYCRRRIIPKIVTVINTIISGRISPLFARKLVGAMIKDYIDYPISLMGSSTQRNRPYQSMFCFDDKGKEIEDSTDVCCVERHIAFEDEEEGVDDFNPLPIMLSSIYSKQETKVRPEISRMVKKVNSDKKKSRSSSASSCRSSSKSDIAPLETDVGFYTIDNFTHDCEVEDDDREELSYTFLDMWDFSRFVDWADFRAAGESLYDAFDANERGLQVWIDYTKKAIENLDEVGDKFRDNIELLCSEEWCTFVLGRRTIENLAWVASEDRPDEYASWHRAWCKSAMELAVSNLHYDVAIAFYRCFWMRFISTMQGGRIQWFAFLRNRLEECPGGYIIRNLLSKEFVKQFRTMLSDIAADNETASGDRGNIGDAITANVVCLIGNLKTRAFKTNVVAELSDLYMNPRLSNLLDIDPDILGTPSGVLVCDDEKITFRKGRPQDYVTKSTSCTYRTDFTADTKIVKEVDEWAEQTFRDAGIIDYWWRFVASLLRGIRAKKVIGMTGAKSNNSKSSWEDAIEKAWGDYAGKMPDDKLNGRGGNSEGPSPIMASMKGLRVVFIDEPDPEKPISAKMLKQMTSDTIYGRKLNENGGKFKPLMTTVIVSNNEPEFTEKGLAMKGRYDAVPFETVWDDKAPEDPDEQRRLRHYKRDMNFPNRIPKLSVGMFWKAVNYYAEFAKRGLSDVPEKIKEKTENYWKGRDTYYQFIAESTIKDEASSIKVNDFFEEFKVWHRNVFPTKRIPDRPMFIAEMQAQWGEPINGSWQGYKSLKDSGGQDYFSMPHAGPASFAGANAMPIIAY